MIAVILKEWRQTLHHPVVTGSAAVLFAGFAGLIAARLRSGVASPYRFFFFAGIFFFGVTLVAMCSRRWQRESADAALNIYLTTTLPRWKIVLGKFLALYLPILFFLVLDHVVDYPAIAIRQGIFDVGFFAALASVIPALASLPTGRKGTLNWSGVLGVFIALPFALQHVFLRPGGVMLPPEVAELPLCRSVAGALFFTLLGFLIALAGMKKPTEDRMRDLHIFCFASVLLLPLAFRYFGNENWRIAQSETAMTAAKLFLLASLFERGKVTKKQKKSWRFPLFATGSCFVWAWSVTLALAAYFTAPHSVDMEFEFGSWFFIGLYVALVRSCGETWSSLRRAVFFGIVWIAAAVVGAFAVVDPRLAWVSPEYFHYFAFSGRFFGILFGVTIFLRAKEIWGFIQSVRRA